MIEKFKIKTKNIVIILIAILLFCVFFTELPHRARYNIEKKMGKDMPLNYSETIGLIYPDTVGGGYDAEYKIEYYYDNKPIPLSSHPKGTRVFIYGYTSRTTDKVTILLNGRPIERTEHRKLENTWFWEEYYSKKVFVSELKGFSPKGKNEIVIINGKYTDTFEIISR